MILNNLFDEVESSKIKLRKKINTLEVENDSLRETIKSELYKEFMKKLEEPEKLIKLKNENKSLKRKNKILKELLGEANEKINNITKTTNCKSKKSKRVYK